MITVHHLNRSRSHRILWLLEELGVEYDVKRYQRDAGMLAPPELRAVHPLGKSPVVTDGDRTIAESGVIIEYLLDRHGQGRLVPSSSAAPDDYWKFRYFMHYAEGSLMPLLVMKLVFSQIPKAKKMPFFMKPVAKAIVGAVGKNYLGPELGKHASFLEGELSSREWFAGNDFSGADIQMSFPVEALFARGGIDELRHPNLAAFVSKIKARPAYRRAMERGGPFDLSA